MKNLLFPALVSISFAISVVGRADELTRAAQVELKSQGFFFGEPDGNLNPESSSAIKRFQIRNGLEATGTLTEQTLAALGLATEPNRAAPSAPPPAAPAQIMPAPTHGPQANSRPVPPQVLPPQATSEPSEAPASPAPVRNGYGPLFERTPFATAPVEVQESTVRKAQSFLARERLFRQPADGMPSEAFEESLLTFQRMARLPLTGRLDLDTLNIMGLLPGGRHGPPAPQTSGRKSRPVSPAYKGIWVR